MDDVRKSGYLLALLLGSFLLPGSADSRERHSEEGIVLQANGSVSHLHGVWNGLVVNGGPQVELGIRASLPWWLYADIELRTRTKGFRKDGADKWIISTVGLEKCFGATCFDVGSSYLDTADFLEKGDDDTRSLSGTDNLRFHVKASHIFRPTERQIIRPWVRVAAYLPLASDFDNGFITDLMIDYEGRMKYAGLEASLGALHDSGAFGFGEGVMGRVRLGVFGRIGTFEFGPVGELLYPLAVSNITQEVDVPSDVLALAARAGVDVPQTIQLTLEDPRNEQGLTLIARFMVRLRF